MVFHTVTMIATLADGAAQATIQVQCALQQATDPWWRWLLPTVVQTAVSLLSVVAGVAIAVWSFRRNRKTEHEQWIRDQKRSDWKQLLKAVAEFGMIVPAVSKIEVDYIQVAEGLISAIQRVEEAYANCLFLEDFLKNERNRDLILAFLQHSTDVASKILSPDHRIRLSRTDQDKLDVSNERSDLSLALRNDYVNFMQTLRSEAHRDIGTAEGISGNTI